ncbi:hypothetical protein MCOR06_001482 [Pyricularia oryzae]|uniref:DUF7708 domain-containing protein n=1 Tax=Pyricularia grisea TaxID=148305 RepID=A0ABQ8NJX1_PYRGI|nr:hypothetical protein MCOR33_005722 [Pyricularia grisea]KAI6512929.1 hypothetical protein MCOR10_009488 [Pyricularia oryzae]KAI6598772.1 hypothetical protein MCOR06_001482 [Pyricularia oryzae]
MYDAIKTPHIASWSCVGNRNESTDDTCKYNSPLARQAFVDAVDRFSDELTKDGRKIQLVANARSLQDVQALLANSLAKYRDGRRFPRARKWLEKSATKINHFSNVINVFVQHNPEYVALAWGSMSLVLMSAQNHENTMSLIAKAMSQIADKLSHVELATVLYPSERMREAVGRLYADILRFLIRAHDWCSESSLRHALHSITRPAELRYKDLLERIDEGAREVERLTNAGAQKQISEMSRMLVQVMDKLETVVSMQALHSSTLMNTNRQLSDLQFSQIMTFVSMGGLGDPQKTFLFHQSLQRRHTRARAAPEAVNRFWESPGLLDWSSATGSSLATMKGGFDARFAMRDFLLKLIRERQAKESTILWALPRPAEDRSSSHRRRAGPIDTRNEPISGVDIIKHLAVQAFRLGAKSASERSMSRQCARFQSATTEREWMELLGSSLMDASRSSQVHILIDLATMDPVLRQADAFLWQAEFERLFVEISRRAPGLQVKVLFLNYGAQTWPGPDPPCSLGIIVPVKVSQTPARKRKYGSDGRGNFQPNGKQRRYF